jgi:hypothetical protein
MKDKFNFTAFKHMRLSHAMKDKLKMKTLSFNKLYELKEQILK